jgi:hypothetical protein
LWRSTNDLNRAPTKYRESAAAPTVNPGTLPRTDPEYHRPVARTFPGSRSLRHPDFPPPNANLNAQIITQGGQVSLRFVTVVPMTVPGKGGRPRKWRSDADRVRAYRARQQGVEEPRVLSVALDDGDDLARAWDTIRQLQKQLAGENEVRQRLQKELNVARRQLDRQQERFGWIEKARTVLQGERDALVAERGELRAELNTLRQRIDAADKRPAAIGVATSATTARPLSRAERRRLEREQQRQERQQ